MKKILMLTIALCLTCMCAFAGPLKVTQGNKKFFKKAEGTASLVIDWSEAKYDNGRETLEAHYQNDLDAVKKAAAPGFIEGFNKKSKNLKISDNGSDYKIEIKLTNLDQYTKVMGFVPGPATNIWGTITVTDTKTGEVVVVVEFDELDGGVNFTPANTVNDSMKELGEKTAKL